MKVKLKHKRNPETFPFIAEMTVEQSGYINIVLTNGMRDHLGFNDIDDLEDTFILIEGDEAFMYYLKLKDLEGQQRVMQVRDRPFSEMTVREHMALSIFNTHPNMTPAHVVGEVDNLLSLLAEKPEQIKEKIEALDKKRQEAESNIPAQLR